jgi:hypothetical protein
MAYLILQYAVLTFAILFSLWHVVNRVSPRSLQALRTRLTGRAPKEAPKSCGTGCDTCRMCATVSALNKDTVKR